MVYTSDIFVNLIKQYSSWDQLADFLQSGEGGCLRIIENNHLSLAIIRYVKGQSDLTSTEKPWVRWMRSVVWDTRSNQPVCVAPPKAYNTDVPSSTDLVVEEFVEGVMVNGFIGHDGNLMWSTRSALGASTGFYGTKTFAAMLEDALISRGASKEWLLSEMKSKNLTFVSFVVQHPEHRVVQKIQAPNVFIIHCGSPDSDGRVHLYDSSTEWPEGLRSWAVKTYAGLNQGETATQRLETLIRTADSTWQGLVFRGLNGDRWRLRSLSYKILRDLRGKESRLEDRFCRLRAQNMARLYTQNWPEDQQKFFELEKRLRGLTSKIYTEYCAVHKEKSKAFLDVAIPLRTPIYQLHGIYLNNLRPVNLTMKMPVVIQYVNNLPVEAQSALLRSSVEIDLAQGGQT